MSKWTGKCDFCDDCEMIHNPQEMIEKSKIYIGYAKLNIRKEKDLIPYYTHLVSSAYYNKEEGNIIHLSRDSFINSEEKEFLAWKVRDCIKYARKAKKEKVPFNYDYVKSQKYFSHWGQDFIWKEIIERINKNNEVIKYHLSSDYRESDYFIQEWIIPNYFRDIHDSMHDRMRREFVEYAYENGFSKLMYNDENKIYYTEGEYHPMIIDFCRAIQDFDEMKKKYEEE